MSTGKIIATLWEACQDTLTDEQLSSLSCGEEIVANLSALSQIMDGLATLVANDEDTGRFRSSPEVADMLWGFSWAVSAAAQAARVANEASAIKKLRAAGEL
ncbi:hypothetical protein HCX48_09535 [Rhodocyclus tenuis]|uniref:Uncharacterized protein n=2 Tax=Rhodocyclus TaxID=1064 RepID=A0A6L5JXN6_RHOTE|nr:hypothetical protein [Rhodocyclus gracilis]MQY52117.1 hypothetical protein [Rhodocyclus gracilis]NJA89461.1 hypothetical protein [Rhodocyclus gracilis]